MVAYGWPMAPGYWLHLVSTSSTDCDPVNLSDASTRVVPWMVFPRLIAFDRHADSLHLFLEYFGAPCCHCDGSPLRRVPRSLGLYPLGTMLDTLNCGVGSPGMYATSRAPQNILSDVPMELGMLQSLSHEASALVCSPLGIECLNTTLPLLSSPFLLRGPWSVHGHLDRWD